MSKNREETTDKTAISEDLAAGGTVRVTEAIQEFRIGRTKLYELMDGGRLAYSQIDGRRLIFRKSILRLLAENSFGV